MSDEAGCLVVWHCVRCGRPVTTWEGGRAWCCPGCYAGGLWAGDREETPRDVLAIGDERRDENKR